MATITNKGRRPIRLPTMHVIPASGSLETTNAVIRCADNWPTLRGLVLSGQATVTEDPEAVPEDEPPSAPATAQAKADADALAADPAPQLSAVRAKTDARRTKAPAADADASTAE